MSACLNSVGLIFDIIGAWLVAYEVVRQFRGQQFERMPTRWGGMPPPEKTSEFQGWEIRRNRFMFVGLVCLTIGFVPQIISNGSKS